MGKHLALAVQLLTLLLPTTPIAQSETPTDFLLVVNLDEVVVMGTRANYLLKNAPVQVEIVNAKTLQSHGSVTLTEILSRLTPSVDLSHSDMGTATQMGGLGGRYIPILVDDKRLMSNLGGQTNLDMVDSTRIERTEVVKGASSALYGSDAIAGVISITTKKDHDSLSIDNSTYVASYGVTNQSDAFQYEVSDWTTLVDFNLKRPDGQ